jgi:hypothetical protein
MLSLALPRKSALSLLACGALLAATAGPARAALVSPVGPFTATGTMTFTVGAMVARCNVTTVGNVNSSGVAVLNAFAAAGTVPCPSINFLGLPSYPVTFPTTSTITVAGFSFNFLGTVCGPATISGSWNNGTSSMAFSSSAVGAGCRISAATLVTNPRLVVR